MAFGMLRGQDEEKIVDPISIAISDLKSERHDSDNTKTRTFRLGSYAQVVDPPDRETAVIRLKRAHLSRSQQES